MGDVLEHFDYAIACLEGLAKKAQFGAIWEVIPIIEDL
jgi:hypothetical protein